MGPGDTLAKSGCHILGSEGPSSQPGSASLPWTRFLLFSRPFPKPSKEDHNTYLVGLLQGKVKCQAGRKCSVHAWLMLLSRGCSEGMGPQCSGRS